jgi:hypothetical protein
MFWYDLKLWQFFKTKHKIWQNLYTLKVHIDCKKKWHNEAIINKRNKKFQNISFEIFFFMKTCFFGKNNPKRIVVLNAN